MIQMRNKIDIKNSIDNLNNKKKGNKIFNIIIKSKIKYSKNKAGILFDLNQLPEKYIYDINKILID